MKKKKNVTPRAVAAPKHAAKPNPFELKGSKRKFDVMGKRDKEGKKNIIKSREEAVNKRKKTLLVEYKQLRKANTFIDRRFGEDDPRLNEEDKALARFQAQRIREAKKSTRFHLQDSSAAAAAAGQQQQQHMLTHGGVSLEELEEMNARPSELLGDLDDDLLEDLVQQYHFGGGEEQQEGQEDGQRKTKKQVMEEIIAKSKAAKAEKARQKEADEAALDALDDSFKAISGGLAAFVKPAGFEKGRKLKAETEEDAAYDRAARELVFEAKGQASERTLTAEELQEKEQQRLAALEAARLKRMRAAAGSGTAAADGEDAADGDGDDEDDEDGGMAAAAAAAPQGGYAAKRARMQREAEEWERRQKRKRQASGDDLDENFALSDEEDEGEDDSEDADGGSGLGARRQAAAAGDHPLQKAFRQAAAKLAAKYGVEAAAAGSGDESDDDEGEEGEEGEEGSSEEGEGEQSEDEEAGTASGGEEAGDNSDDAEQQGAGSGSDDEQEAADAAAAPKLQQKQQQQQQQQLDGPLDLSYTPAVPESYAEFAALVGGRPAQQLALAVQRIRVYNAAALATDSKRKLQVFYGILVQHFALLAGQQPCPTAHLDTLTTVLLQLTPESQRVKLVAPREFNPRFEADFALGADYDPDRQRSEARKLQRQLVKEKRGAMRELRRDAVFMSAERDAEKGRVDAERLASERAFYSELQVQEADAKSGGQKGLNPHRKKKK
ncbi:hypothetical protein OEZ85_009894 [Tetradesmus obliquus]|uniref:NUC153 domain-containing protein n=1 Tax=Tetradesmus obliquus TaxID=3088 RepID=A0ABY8UAN7_TETOB|nr:hypothetical protein OEZ85_009894 [Tetradesmus obliquus]